MTIQSTDLFLVSSGGSKKCEAQNLNGKTGNVLVNRGGVSHKTGIVNIPTTVLNNDLMLVNRGGASFKATGADVQTLFPQGPAGGTSVIETVVDNGSTSTLTLADTRNLDTFTSGDGLKMVDFNGNTAAYVPITSAITAATPSTLAGNWTSATQAVERKWDSLVYGGGRFVAIAVESTSVTNQVMYSDDGLTWLSASATEINSWQSVTYGNGKFVAVSYDGNNRVMYSEDGISWTAASATEDNAWYSVTYGNGKFVAVAGTGNNRVMYSIDGISWFVAGATEANSWYSVTYGGGKFVAVSYDGNNRVMYSADGVSWSSAAAAEANSWVSVAYGDGKFVAVGYSGTNRVMHSTNAINWTAAAATELNNWRSVVYGKDKFVAVSYDGNNRVMYSADGVSWSSAAAAEANSWVSVAYGAAKFVAVSMNGVNQVMWSYTGGTTENLATLALTPTSKDLKYFTLGDTVTQASNSGTIKSIGTNELLLTNTSGNWTTSVGQAAQLSKSLSGTGTYRSYTGNETTVYDSNTQWVDNDNQRGNNYYVTTGTARLSLAKALTIDDYGVMTASARQWAATAIAGYYPLFRFERIAKLVGDGTAHSHIFDGVTWYMPNGVTYYHGDYSS